jgi:hypothetical protein
MCGEVESVVDFSTLRFGFYNTRIGLRVCEGYMA